MAFRGRFFCKLDAKGRLSLPSAYGVEKAEKHPFVITNAKTQNQRFLDAYPLKEWEKLEKRVLKWPSLDKSVQAFQRFYLSSGQVVETDSNSRFLIPQSLRQYAGLQEQSEVVLVGMGQKIEIWNGECWDKLFGQMESSYDNILQEIALLQSKKE
jgi:MraZ protein